MHLRRSWRRVSQLGRGGSLVRYGALLFSAISELGESATQNATIFRIDRQKIGHPQPPRPAIHQASVHKYAYMTNCLHHCTLRVFRSVTMKRITHVIPTSSQKINRDPLPIRARPTPFTPNVICVKLKTTPSFPPLRMERKRRPLVISAALH